MSKFGQFLLVDGKEKWAEVSKGAGREAKVLEKRRQNLLESLGKTLAAVQADPKNPPKRAWWSVAGDIAEVTIRIGSRRLPIEGEATEGYVSVTKLMDFYAAVVDAVSGGEFDEAITNLFAKPAKGKTAAKAKRADGAKPKNKGWDEERRARYQATVAKKRAEREAQKGKAA